MRSYRKHRPTSRDDAHLGIAHGPDPGQRSGRRGIVRDELLPRHEAVLVGQA